MIWILAPFLTIVKAIWPLRESSMSVHNLPSTFHSAVLNTQLRVVERAETVFEDADGALSWLLSPNASLAGVTPLSLLDTEIGADSVLDTLGRIEHGVFA
jgi:putative toxin-antitoxin system antitoxin component (TIGR02293 family)